MKTLVRLLPSFGAFTWMLWYCTQAKWDEVIAPNFLGLVTVTTITTIILWVGTRTRKKKKVTALTYHNYDISKTPELIAREVYTWRTVTRERSIYAEPK